ncbi:MAG TPA: hypothetical protein VK644_12190 [Chitinophagaceae bacterium]|nr:hypothetical protein [Chitinophagaceae bacterium]
MRSGRFLFLCCAILLLQSCEFSCSVGGKKGEIKAPVVDGNTRIYNGIQLRSNKLKIDKAYLIFGNGEKVPADNFVDFSQPVKVVLLIDSGWTIRDNKAFLGASEKITMEGGQLILDEKDLFAQAYSGGVTANDAKTIALTATLRLKKNAPPTSFKIDFRVWDKEGDAFAEGSYTLFSK